MSSRFRPRFTVRTLTIFVTLICAYFGAWEATKRYGVVKTPGVSKSQGSARINIPAGTMPPKKIIVASSSPAPFVISTSEYVAEYFTESRIDRQYSVVNGPVHYHLWLFGPTYRLPLESSW
jgi:hypothetical protein